MSHIGDTNKMVSDTPRTDMMEQHAPVGIRRNSAFEQASDFSRQLERELNVANAIIRQQQLLDEENLRLQERIKRLEDCIETAWGIIANVSGGDWTRQKPHWQEAVVRWRDNDFHPIMKELSERKAKEAKL